MILDSSFSDAILDILSSPDYKFDIKMFDDFLTPTLVPSKARWVYVKKQNTFMKLPDTSSNDMQLTIYIMNNEIITLIKNAIQRIRSCAGQYGVIVNINVLSNKNRRKIFSNIIGKYIEQKRMNESQKKFSEYTIDDILDLIENSPEPFKVKYYKHSNDIFSIYKKVFPKDRDNGEYKISIRKSSNDNYEYSYDKTDLLVSLYSGNTEVQFFRINPDDSNYNKFIPYIREFMDNVIRTDGNKNNDDIIYESYDNKVFSTNDTDALSSANVYRKTDNRKEKLTLLSLHKLRRIRESRKYELLKKYQIMNIIYSKQSDESDSSGF